MKLIKVRLRGRTAHFGTPFSNHSSKGSHRIPSKSMMKGMLGAALGLDFKESQDLPNRFSFKWVSDVSNSIVTKRGMMLKYSNDIKTVLVSKDWERGTFKPTLDSIEYLHSLPYLECDWFIEVDDNDLEPIKNGLENPIYPIYLGVSDALVKVVNIEEIKANEIKVEVGSFNDLFIGDSEEYLFEERMTETMKGYRKPSKLVDVYTGHETVRGIPKESFYRINNEDICMW